MDSFSKSFILCGLESTVKRGVNSKVCRGRNKENGARGGGGVS